MYRVEPNPIERKYRVLIPAPSVFWNVDLVAKRVQDAAKRTFEQVEKEELKRFFSS